MTTERDTANWILVLLGEKPEEILYKDVRSMKTQIKIINDLEKLRNHVESGFVHFVKDYTGMIEDIILNSNDLQICGVDIESFGVEDTVSPDGDIPDAQLLDLIQLTEKIFDPLDEDALISRLDDKDIEPDYRMIAEFVVKPKNDFSSGPVIEQLFTDLNLEITMKFCHQDTVFIYPLVDDHVSSNPEKISTLAGGLEKYKKLILYDTCLHLLGLPIEPRRLIDAMKEVRDAILSCPSGLESIRLADIQE